MKKLFVFGILLLFALISFDGYTQIVGDYRSLGGGTDWNTAGNWERCAVNGVWPGVASATFPGQIAAVAGTTVTIRNGHTRIIDTAVPNPLVNLQVGEGASGILSVGVPAAGSGLNLTCTGTVTISTGGTLNSAGNDVGDFHVLNFQSTLTNNGTISFTGATDQITLNVTGITTNNGTLTFSTNLGVKTFNGAVTNTGTWTSTTLVNTANLVFRNGVSSTGGTFAAGGATFNTNTPRSIGGTAAMSFSGIVTIGAGITITNDNTNTLTLSNTAVALASGGAGSTFTQGSTGNTLSYGGSSIGVVNFNATGSNNTVNYSGGVAQDVRDVAYVNLTTSGSNTKTWTLAAGRIISGNLTVGTGTTLVTVNNQTLGVNLLTNVTGNLNLGGTGTKTFTGAVTVNVGGVWNLTGAVQPTSFGGGITMNGTTFNNGTGATAISATQSLLGSSAMTFGGIVTIAGGATLTNNNTNTVTLSNAGVALAGGGTFTQGATGNTLSYAGSSIGVTNFNASGAGNTVNYSGAAQAVRDVAYINLTTSGSNTKTWTLGAGRIVSGNLTVGSGTTLVTVNNQTLGVNLLTNVTGNLNLGGTGTKTFTGAVTVNVGGVWNLTGAVQPTSFGGGITMNGTTFNNGTGAAAFTATQSLLGSSNMTFGGTVTPAAATTLTNSNTGTVTISSTGSIVLTGNFTQGINSTLALAAAAPFSGAQTFNASTNANTVNYTGAAQTVKAVAYRTLGLSGSGVKTMTGVTTIGTDFNIGGTASATAVAALTIGGNITLGLATTFNTGAFTHNVAGNWINNGTNFTNTGSTINFNGSIAQSVGGTTSTTFNNLTITGSNTVTFNINTATVGDFTIGGTASATAADDLTIGGIFTLGAGRTFTAGAFTHNLTGNWVNNGGTFNNAGSTINLNGTTQSIGGSGSTTFNNLTLSSSGITTVGIATFIAGNLGISDGTVVNLGGLTTHTANTLSLGGRGQSAGTWGGTGSGATNVSSTYFTASSGFVTVGLSTGGSLPYQEDFAGEPNGATSNTSPPWSVTQFPSSGTFSKEQPINLIFNDAFEINNTGATEGVWQTADLDIGASFTKVAISLEITVNETSVTDYVNVYYVWDAAGSGSEVLIQSITTASTAVSFILPSAGHSKIRLVIRAKENTAGGTFFGIFPREFVLDNINLIGVRTLYSRASTEWSNANTWSFIGINDVTPCGCVPAATDEYIIGGGNTVNLTANAGAAFVTVNGTADALGAGTLDLSTFGLTVGLGGPLTVNNGGTITSSAGSSITLSDNLNHTLTNNGAIAVDNFVVTNNSFFVPMAVTINGSGTFAITNNLTLNSNAFGTQPVTLTNNSPMSIANIATINDGTTFTNNSTTTMTRAVVGALTGAGTWTQGPNSTLNYRSPSLTITTFNASNTGNTVNYNRGGVQSIATTTYYNLTLSTSGAKSALGSFVLLGNWTSSNTATFTPGAFTVTFNGTTPQTISASTVGGGTFAGLTISNAITLNSPVTVTGTLTMVEGNTDLNGNTITLGVSAAAPGTLSHAGSSANGWMYGGSLVRFMAASNATTIGGGDQNEGFFPLGSTSDFRPFYVGKDSNAGTGGSITVTHNDATTTSIVNIPDTNPIATITRRHDSNWAVTTSGITGGTWTLRAGGTNFGTIQEVGDIRLSTSASVVGTNAIAIGGPSDWRANRTGLTFGELTNNFHIASTDAVNSPLPIELVFFKGLLANDAVRLFWETASELNNDFFTVERLNEGDAFDPIAVVKGSGTVNETKTYQAFDYAPKEGRNYYRLKQTDFDGKVSYSSMVMVDFKDEGEIVNVYPNPTAQETITIELKQLRPGQQVPLQIRSMIGVQAFSNTFGADSTGKINVRIQVDQWPQGLYLVQIGTDTPVQRKIVIE